MRTVHLAAVVAAALAIPGAARAQLAHRSIALEAGISRDLGGSGGAAGVAALRATAWLEGPLEAVARVALGSARATGGRGADGLAGAIGLRLSGGTGPVRPQIEADLGWARIRRGEGALDVLAWGLGAGLEWFPALDLSVALRGGARGAGGGIAAEVVASVAAYF